MKPYLIFQNKYFYGLGKVYLESDFRFFIEQNLFKLRNILWGSQINLFHNICPETTSICNRNCSYCPNSKYPRPKKLMPIFRIFKIIDGLAEINYKGKICPHLYGEPLLDTRMPTIVEYIRKKLPKSKITIYTNGDFLTPSLFKLLISCGVTFFDITQHEGGITDNMKDILAFLEENPKFKKYVGYKSRLFFDNRGGLLDIKNITKRKKCFALSNSLVINYKGDVILCCNDYFGKHKFGNLFKQKIMDVWNNLEYIKLRNECGNGKFNLEICNRCLG